MGFSFLKTHSKIVVGGSVLILLVSALVFDTALAVGLLMLFAFSGIALFFAFKHTEKGNAFLLLSLLTLILHVPLVIFISYAHYYPFGYGEGDQAYYHRAAVEIAEDFRSGNFSISDIKVHLEKEYTPHYFPAIVGGLYALTFPEKIIGQMFSIWWTVLSVWLVYMVSRELGVSNKSALIAGFLAVLYPSYLYFGSLVLRESFVAVLVLSLLYLLMRLLRAFSLKQFSVFFLILFLLVHFRFYFGIAVLFAFFPVWLIVSRMELRKRILYGICCSLLLGSIPYVQGHGFFFAKTIEYHFNPTIITSFQGEQDVLRRLETEPGELSQQDQERIESGVNRDRIPSQPKQDDPLPTQDMSNENVPVEKNVPEDIDIGSTIVQSLDFHNPVSFAKNYSIAFSSVAIGPFPWQIRYVRQIPVLLETIPWFFIFFFTVRGVFAARSRWRDFLPILFVTLLVMAAIALFINNYGTFARIRIPAFLALLTLFPLYLETSAFWKRIASRFLV